MGNDCLSKFCAVFAFSAREIGVINDDAFRGGYYLRMWGNRARAIWLVHTSDSEEAGASAILRMWCGVRVHSFLSISSITIAIAAPIAPSQIPRRSHQLWKKTATSVVPIIIRKDSRLNRPLTNFSSNVSSCSIFRDYSLVRMIFSYSGRIQT